MLVACGLALAAPAPAQAQERSRPGAGSVLDVASLDRAAALRIRAEARARLADAAAPSRGGDPADVLLEEAIARYEAVSTVFPDDASVWLELGIALARFERQDADGRHVERIDDAIRALERARALSPDAAEIIVASELAALRAHRQDFAGAAAEWQRVWDARESVAPIAEAQSLLLPLAQREATLHELLGASSLDAATVHGNWAEMRMLAGDAAGAVEQYRFAVGAARVGSRAVALGLWGLALASERAGAHEEALESALSAMDADHARRSAHGASTENDFAALHEEGVFFEPACEIHAYEALGHEALATRASTDEGRAVEWARALRSTRYFLAEGGRSSIYADAARDAEARLAALLGRE